jgi:5-methyltetrahydrofolate--homocysteine methyltransferase
MSQELINAIVEMREADAVRIADDLLESGTDPLDILGACREAMGIVGQHFEDGEMFVPELIMAGEILSKISDEAKPYIKEEEGAEPTETPGTVVIGTVEGDIHDIGKDLVVFMLDVNGFEVVDLGVDVPPASFVDAAQEHDAQILGLSGFLTLAYEPMKATVKALKDVGLNGVKVMIGGGQVDDQIRDYTGADAYGRDAQAAVRLAKQWTNSA